MKKIIIFAVVLLFSCQKRTEISEIKQDIKNSSSFISYLNPYDNDASAYYSFMHDNFAKYKSGVLSDNVFDSVIVNSIYYVKSVELNAEEKKE